MNRVSEFMLQLSKDLIEKKDVTENNKKTQKLVELESPDASKIKQQSLVARERVYKMKGGKKKKASIKKKVRSNKTKRRRAYL